MPTVEQRADEILAVEMPTALERRAVALFDAVPHITTLLRALEQWHKDNGDEPGFRLVEKLTLAMATHEAETE
jgi:hypothetical protein